ncbi:hypothetical protein VNI00_005380 [Paramarasmius palmivorus]|uniref:Uncharacterized protein n=1 Tax=Paramarasmius palmivorus TaxID=297713 RepID=A0AAW0DBN0_9AGAR
MNQNVPASKLSTTDGDAAQPEAYSTVEPYYSEYSRMLRIPGEKDETKNMKWAESHMANLTLAPRAVVEDTPVMVEMEVVSQTASGEPTSRDPSAMDVDADVEMSNGMEYGSARKRKASDESGNPDIEIDAPPCKRK